MLQQNPHPFETQMRLTQPTHQWPEIRECSFKLLQPLPFFYTQYLSLNQKLRSTQRREKI